MIKFYDAVSYTDPECQTQMLGHSMDIYRLTVYVRQESYRTNNKYGQEGSSFSFQWLVSFIFQIKGTNYIAKLGWKPVGYGKTWRHFIV